MEADSRVRGWRLLAATAGLTVLVVVAAVTSPPGRVRLDLLSSVVLVLPALATAARARFPVAVLAVATLGLVVYQVRGYPGVAPALTVMVALFATVRAGHRWAAGVAVAVSLLGGFAGELAAPGDPDQGVFQRWLLLVGWLLASCVAAELSRQRRHQLGLVEERAATAERTREETARRRADEERLRIARDLHDALTHSISLINVQAGVAVHLARKNGESVPEALVTIQETGREAMRELRATLEVLRADDTAGGAGLDRLDRLVEGARKAGLPVTVTVNGLPRDLPAPVDRTAYRIVQEALTNVTRHAGPASAAVRLDYGECELSVRVDDDGTGSGAPGGTGVGLVGMRERVAALGGSLHAGPRSGTGFSVRATLPMEAPS
ncbi:sensor histidine kinase [Actinoplanes friuliensis]|uniref:Oxygen sensor histidine kinase NreB n=1 Tax=Actinoplanes friuliensis DSM 7358 TaxID=1246995 RepID=U5VXI9_9ACTN|nr:sensor histidine kinase [Actinoplanes friuliensis]AGZ41512.1 histidine kinase [Actinoplanes friuliensis DSM 7358]